MTPHGPTREENYRGSLVTGVVPGSVTECDSNNNVYNDRTGHPVSICGLLIHTQACILAQAYAYISHTYIIHREYFHNRFISQSHFDLKFLPFSEFMY